LALPYLTFNYDPFQLSNSTM